MMDETEAEIVIPPGQDVIVLETDAEPITPEEVTEPEPIAESESEAWQLTEVSQEIRNLHDSLASVLLSSENLQVHLRETENRQTEIMNLLQLALPGLQVLATLADETTDRKTRQQINQTMRGRR